MRTQTDFINHLKHCIQEEHGIQLSDKAAGDIKETINGAYLAAAHGAEQRRKAADIRYYEQKTMYELLINAIGRG